EYTCRDKFCTKLASVAEISMMADCFPARMIPSTTSGVRSLEASYGRAMAQVSKQVSLFGD
ncbi:MAG: hypothetical protein ACKOQ6_01765, partial [Bacteroidota bacterium]